jgi:hypothetical protein
MGPPQRCMRPTRQVTISVWPSGCVCQAVRAAGSKVTQAPAARAGEEAEIGFKVHPHMLRHACGYALANKGIDTQTLQAYRPTWATAQSIRRRATPRWRRPVQEHLRAGVGVQCVGP